MKTEKVKKITSFVLFFIVLVTDILRNHEIISRTVDDIIIGIALIGLVLHMIVFHYYRKTSSNKGS